MCLINERHAIAVQSDSNIASISTVAGSSLTVRFHVNVVGHLLGQNTCYHLNHCYLLDHYIHTQVTRHHLS